jgi:hypothetical protein
VIADPFGRNEGGHGLVGRRALGPFRRGEQAGYEPAAGTQDPGRRGQGPARVPGELEGVHAGHRVEGGVAERQRLHVPLAQVGLREPLAGDAEQAGADVEAGRDGTASGGQGDGEAGAAADVEQAGAAGHLGSVEDRLEQGAVMGFGQVGPGPGIGAPQAALDLGGGAEPAHAVVTRGCPRAARPGGRTGRR